MIQVFEILPESKVKSLKKIIKEKNDSENFIVSRKIIKIIKRTGSRFLFEIQEPNKFFESKYTEITLHTKDKINTLSANGENIYKYPIFSIYFTLNGLFERKFNLIYRSENSTINKKTILKKVSWFKTISEEVEEIEYKESSYYEFNFLDKNKNEVNFPDLIQQMKKDDVDILYINTVETIVDKVNTLFKEVIAEFEISNKIKNDEIKTITIDETFNTLGLQEVIRFYQAEKSISDKHTEDIVKLMDYLNSRNNEITELKKSLSKLQYNSDKKLLLLKDVVKSYNSMLFLSYCFTQAIFVNDLVTYYQIRVFLDRYNVFNSNYQNLVIAELNKVNDNLKVVIDSIMKSQENIVKEIRLLSDNLGDTIYNLQSSITKDLSSIESVIKWNNLLTVVQTYQLYRINKKIKK
jgi:hypothetical protein